MSYIKAFPITILMGLCFLVSSCETWRANCGGEIIVENTIPDTTLYEGGETFRRDLFEPPVVFRHTEGKSISFTATSTKGGTIVGANRTGLKGTILEVTPRMEGNTEVIVVASDGCGEKETRFEVMVLDSTNQSREF